MKKNYAFLLLLLALVWGACAQNQYWTYQSRTIDNSAHYAVSKIFLP